MKKNLKHLTQQSRWSELQMKNNWKRNIQVCFKYVPFHKISDHHFVFGFCIYKNKGNQFFVCLIIIILCDRFAMEHTAHFPRVLQAFFYIYYDLTFRL